MTKGKLRIALDHVAGARGKAKSEPIRDLTSEAGLLAWLEEQMREFLAAKTARRFRESRIDWNNSVGMQQEVSAIGRTADGEIIEVRLVSKGRRAHG